jgi:hypothetical protein
MVQEKIDSSKNNLAEDHDSYDCACAERNKILNILDENI